ncbi:MAG: c-type cytochrome [Phycisphaerales bacterium]
MKPVVPSSIVILALLLGAACERRQPPPPAPPPPPDPAMVAEGERLFVKHQCISCHSTDGTPGLAPTLAGIYGTKQKLMDGREVTVDIPYLRRSLIDPGADLVPDYPAQMLSYAKLMNEREIAAVIAYIRTLKPADEMEAPDYPAGDGAQAWGGPEQMVDAGRKLHAIKACNACHSIDGSKNIGASLAGIYGTQRPMADGRSVLADDAYFRRATFDPAFELNAGYANQMLSYTGQVTPNEMDALIAYYKSLPTPATPDGR